MRGRLGFVVMLNPGRLAGALEAQGLTVTLPRNKREYRRAPLTISTQFDVPNGTSYDVTLAGLERHLTEMVMEAHPVEYFVQIAVALAAAARTHALGATAA